MIIGIPKEIMHGEYRVAAIPETVKKLVDDGHTVLFEKGAGLGAFYHDEDYAKAGAKMYDDVQKLFDDAEVILKVKEPLHNETYDKDEVDMMHKGQYLITFIHPASPVNHEMVKKMAKNGVIGLTLDGVPRISRAQNMDALSSMSSCAGYKGMIMGVDDLPKFMPLISCAVGMIKPANVLVIGTGVAGLRAIATAKALGAKVSAVDIRPQAEENATSLGAKIVPTGVPAEIAVGEGGYANKLPDEWILKERENIRAAVEDADVVFLSALVPGKIAPQLITEDMVKNMRPGSVIVDIAIDQGGNCTITSPGIKERKHGVMIQGIKNIPGMLPTSSTWMFAHNIYNLVKYLNKDGKIALDLEDEICRKILVTDGEKIVHEGAKEAMGL
ncbi:MAG: NAD(P) transhydrogenase subunit alpha [Clostridia bacterium]|nr:NAD(P) transhydrogenase subunit alpha [Clostridia bacterium]MDY5264920.1 NAD(P) transhydrogenase subunit alpha [Eubacteriales bacterium]MDY5440598.1 NAD(P) transhydrogenase subunit alpha [Eubacteriales bacterium]